MKTDGVLRPVSLLSKTESKDENGNVTFTYKQGDNTIDKAEYDRLYSSIYDNAADTGYEAKGVFRWDYSKYPTPTTALWPCSRTPGPTNLWSKLKVLIPRFYGKAGIFCLNRLESSR